nr:hypothetical protein Iba_chr02aCG22120 [Ipomoea batatas]GMC61756.1 hypothetical protein Iba_chr02bCG23070 [Ipomoea batatas]
MQTPSHKQQGVPSQQVRYRTGVARLEKPALVLENEPVRLRVGRENGRFAEDVGGENRPVFGNPVVDERLRVGRLVGGDELQRLADQGQPEVVLMEHTSGKVWRMDGHHIPMELGEFWKQELGIMDGNKN